MAAKESIIHAFIFSILPTIALIIGIFLSVTEDKDEDEDAKKTKKLLIEKIVTYIIAITLILFLCFVNPQNFICGILVGLVTSLVIAFLDTEYFGVWFSCWIAIIGIASVACAA